MPQNNINTNNSGSSSSGDELTDIEDEKTFNERLYKFMVDRGSPIEKIPIFDHRELDLYQLYKGVITRGGLETVIENKLWRQITNELSVDPERRDAGFRLRIHYLKYLYPYERRYFLGLADDDFDYEAYERQISKSHSAASNKERTIRSLPARKKKMVHMNGGHYTYAHSNNYNNNPTTNQRDNHNNASNNKEANNHNNGNNTIHKESSNQSDKHLSSDKPKRSTLLPVSLVNNFKSLEFITLQRYKKFHKLKLAAGSTSKRELTEAVMHHFAGQKVEEDTVINAFVAHVRSLGSRESQREREQRRRNASRKIFSSSYDDR